MQSLKLIIYILTSSVVLFTLYILVIYVRHNFNSNLKNKGISVLLAFIFLRFLSDHLFFTGNILDYPHFLLVNEIVIRFSTPTLFLMIFITYTNKRFKWWDGLHFLPLIFFIINFNQVIFLPGSEKVEILKVMNDQGYSHVLSLGIFTKFIRFDIIQAIYLGIYSSLTGWIIIYSNKGFIVPDHLQKISRLVFWFLFTSFIPAFLIAMGPDWVDKYLIVNIFGFIFAFAILIGFFYAPQFLYGKDFLNINDFNYSSVGDYPIKVENDKNGVGSQNDILFINKIDSYFNQSTSFLSDSFNIKTLEEILHASGDSISKSIQDNYQMDFDEYVDLKRLKYFNKIYIEIPSNRKKTIDQIANELGFKSPKNFYTLFKKHYETTPEKYLEGFTENSDDY